MRALFLVAGVLLALPALAQPSDDRRPPMFVISGGDQPVYLLGSVHLLLDGALPLPPHVEAAYDRADVLAFELDLDLAEAGAMGMMASAMDETLIADALTDTQRDSLSAWLGAIGMPATALDAFEPWFGSLMLGVLGLQRSGLPVADGGVDSYLFGRAKADGKDRVALETMERQTAAFDDLSTDTQVRYLLGSLATPADSLAGQFTALIDAWASGDDDRLASMMNDGFDHPELAEAVLLRRNRAWVPQIESLVAAGRAALIVVGAGHLVGEGSVVDLLRQAGYAVERL